MIDGSNDVDKMDELDDGGIDDFDFIFVVE